MCYNNKRFYIVKNDLIQNVPCHVMNYSPMLLGRPVMKMSPLYNPGTVVPIKIRTPDLTFTLNTPFQHVRPLFDDIYRYRVQYPNEKSSEVVYNVQLPSLNTSVSTSYPVFLRIMQQVGSLYSPGTYVETENGLRLKGLELVDGLLQKLINAKKNQN